MRYEMLWDCPRCETPKLLGLTHRHCPNCGGAQDPTRRYFPAEADKIAVEDHPFVGRDKACKGCESPNAATAEFCVNCGNSLADAGEVIVRADQLAAPAGFADDSAKAAAAEAQARKLADRQPAATPPKRSAGVGLGLIVAGALAVIFTVVICAVGAFWTQDAGVTVTGHTWARSIGVEQRRAVRDEAWKDAVPLGAEGVSCQQAERSTKQVPDGEDCQAQRVDNGDGSFSEKQVCTPRFRDEPVYDQKCSFTVVRWVLDRTERAEGAGLTPEPAWPSVVLGQAGDCLGCEREATRAETYTVTFVADDGEALSCTTDADRWRGLALSSTWIAPVGLLSDSIDCAALKTR